MISVDGYITSSLSLCSWTNKTLFNASCFQCLIIRSDETLDNNYLITLDSWKMPPFHCKDYEQWAKVAAGSETPEAEIIFRALWALEFKSQSDLGIRPVGHLKVQQPESLCFSIGGCVRTDSWHSSCELSRVAAWAGQMPHAHPGPKSHTLQWSRRYFPWSPRLLCTSELCSQYWFFTGWGAIMLY